MISVILNASINPANSFFCSLWQPAQRSHPSTNSLHMPVQPGIGNSVPFAGCFGMSSYQLKKKPPSLFIRKTGMWLALFRSEINDIFTKSSKSTFRTVNQRFSQINIFYFGCFYETP
jgi:hypothetical protein